VNPIISLHEHDAPNLHMVKEHLRDYAGFLSELLRADVEFVDLNYRRVVGTGFYESANDLISSGAIYAEVFRTEKYILIDDPRKHAVCQQCKLRNKCLEKIEIAHPIIANGKIAGAVGIASTSATERQHIMSSIKFLLFLLNKTCMFLGKQLAIGTALAHAVQRIERLETDLSERDAAASLPNSIRKLVDVERVEIEKALDFFGRDTAGKQKAAKALGIGIATLYRKINEDRP